jgi:hypothetical protein
LDKNGFLYMENNSGKKERRPLAGTRTAQFLII